MKEKGIIIKVPLRSPAIKVLKLPLKGTEGDSIISTIQWDASPC